MSRTPKLLAKAIARNRNLRFEELTRLAEAFGFREIRISGSHHIYSHADVPGLLNLQDAHGQAKPYQVRQFLKLVEMYNFELGEEP